MLVDRVQRSRPGELWSLRRDGPEASRRFRTCSYGLPGDLTMDRVHAKKRQLGLGTQRALCPAQADGRQRV